MKVLLLEPTLKFPRIGRRWRGLSPQEKEHWNNLAEEEKKNHAKKYPGYRYTQEEMVETKIVLFVKINPFLIINLILLVE